MLQPEAAKAQVSDRIGVLSMVRAGMSLLSPGERWRALLIGIAIAVSGILETTVMASVFPLIALSVDRERVVADARFLSVSKVLGNPPVDSLIMWLMLGVGVLVVLTATIGFGVQFLIQQFGRRAKDRYCHELMIRLVNAPYQWYLTQNSVLLTRHIVGDTEKWEGAFLRPLLQVGNSLITVTMACALVVTIAPLAGLIVLVAVALVALPAARASRIRVQYYSRYQKDISSRMLLLASHLFGGVKDVKLSAVPGRAVSLFDDLNQRLNAARVRQSLWKILPAAGLMMIGQLAFIGAAALIFTTSTSAGSALAQLAVMGVVASRLLPAVNRMASEFSGLVVSFPFVNDLIRLGNDIEHSALVTRRVDGVPVPANWRRLRFVAAGFAYVDGEPAALSDIDLTIERGRSYGIVGASGAGKTTLIDLLLGLLEPTVGSIQLDDQPLRNVDLQQWQRHIGYVPQSPYLFDASLRENIAFGEPGSAELDERIRRALQRAQLADLLAELPDGLDSKLGERGVRLSGGQAQRIAIARALFKEPDILILDEATSALDTISEGMVQQAITDVARDVTTVSVSHRLSTVKNCDRIFVIANGRLAASGTYKELLKESPHFRRLANELADPDYVSVKSVG